MSIPEGKYEIISVSTNYPEPPLENPSLVVSSGVNNPVTIKAGPSIPGQEIWHVTPLDPADGLYEIRHADSFLGLIDGNIQPHQGVIAGSQPSIPWKLEVTPANGGYLTTIRPAGPQLVGVDIHIGLHHDQLQIHFVPLDFKGDRAEWFFRRVEV